MEYEEESEEGVIEALNKGLTVSGMTFIDIDWMSPFSLEEMDD